MQTIIKSQNAHLNALEQQENLSASHPPISNATMEHHSPPKPSLTFPEGSRTFIDPYLPNTLTKKEKPFVTLTFAQSLDSKLSLAPGTQTVLSGPETKAMTHYLRSKHDAILVGIGTAVADDPSLNCRLDGVGLDDQPRPIILDPKLRWTPETWPKKMPECMALAQHGRGKAPWILHSKLLDGADPSYVECVGQRQGQFIRLPEVSGEMDWHAILTDLGNLGIDSIMIEGGAKVINTLLQEKYLRLIDSVIITIAPVWLGADGVTVTPPAVNSSDGTPSAVARVEQNKWQQFGQDVVMCGRVR
jgi:2,5-diamino-6-(ribosylamino)-4(3H)-pyrimidinone 5'-phosphate reductase